MKSGIPRESSWSLRPPGARRQRISCIAPTVASLISRSGLMRKGWLPGPTMEVIRSPDTLGLINRMWFNCPRRSYFKTCPGLGGAWWHGEGGEDEASSTVLVPAHCRLFVSELPAARSWEENILSLPPAFKHFKIKCNDCASLVSTPTLFKSGRTPDFANRLISLPAPQPAPLSHSPSSPPL